jgi:hypothetical protein
LFSLSHFLGLSSPSHPLLLSLFLTVLPTLVFYFKKKFSISLSVPRPLFFLNLIFSSSSLSHVLS